MSGIADKQTERALRSQRARHMQQIRQCAERIHRDAGFILQRLDAGTVPATFSLVTDAVEIETRRAALEALSEVTDIYEAQADDA